MKGLILKNWRAFGSMVRICRELIWVEYGELGQFWRNGHDGLVVGLASVDEPHDH